MVSEQGKKLLYDIIIIAIAVVFFALAVYTYEHKDEIIYNIEYTLTNDTLRQQVIIIDFNFTSDVFSAQNTIKVDGRGYYNPDFVIHHPYTQNSTSLFVYFPSYSDNAIFHDGHLVSTPIILTRNSGDGIFRGGGNIIFAQEGDKCPLVLETFSPIVNPKCKLNETGLIHISSADSLFQLRTAKITLALTYVLIAFTVLSIRDFIKGVAHNIQVFINRNKVKKDDPVKSHQG